MVSYLILWHLPVIPTFALSACGSIGNFIWTPQRDVLGGEESEETRESTH